jgi:hypothetical protein
MRTPPTNFSFGMLFGTEFNPSSFLIFVSFVIPLPDPYYTPLNSCFPSKLFRHQIIPAPDLAPALNPLPNRNLARNLTPAPLVAALARISHCA